MSTPEFLHLMIPEAHKLLKAYDCVVDASGNVAIPKDRTRQALCLVTQVADYLTIGICAETVDEAFAAVENYLAAFGYDVSLTRENREDPVFLKFNTKKELCYLDSYTGHYRGVLVTCHSATQDLYNNTYGHFPLDLFSSD